jgi:hypothetical protein
MSEVATTTTGTTTATAATSGSPAATTATPATTQATAPSRPGAISNAAYDGLDPAEQGKYALVRKGPDGGSEWVHRDSLAPEQPGDKTGTDGALDPKAMAPGSKIKIAGADGVTFELDANDIAALMQQKAAADLRKTQIPTSAADYQPSLPKDFVLPQGIEFKVDNSDPALQDLRNLAMNRGWSQEDFSAALGIHAAREARQEAAFRTAAAAEIEKMGANATMRVTAIESFLRGHVGDELATPMRSMIVSEKIARGFERLMAKFSSQGAASFRQDGRAPHEGPGRVDEATFNKMSAGERLDYARQFPQEQFRNGR